ncbi:MAG TPA: succinate dehydrogenase, cytochrome b556 subunit [Longimicrobiaceae bacterium]|nr:succinate dehydrogenase, cytochrome b556 subunit [Longimicrobiaceae bacterium]
MAPHSVRGIWTALRYRGREGMWSWILHRATGLGILAFLIVHVLDTAVVIYWPDFYDHTLDLYRTPFFRVAELLIFFAVLYHAVNGLRIVVQDFWPAVMRHERQLVWAVAGIVGVAMLPIAWIMLAPMLGLAEEPGGERHRARAGTRVEAPAAAPRARPSAPPAPAVVPPLPEARP